MVGNTFTIPIDIKLRQTSIVPRFVQYDTGILRFYITDNGQPIDLTELTGQEITLKRVVDGVVFLEDMTIETINGKSYVVYQFKGSEMSKTGMIETAVSLFFNEYKVTTLPFKVEIVDDLQGGVITEAVQEVGVLRRLINEVEDLRDSVLPNAENLENKGNYNSTTTYKKNNIVSYNGSSYMSRVNNNLNNTPPTNATNTYWELIARKGADGNGTVVRHIEKFIATSGQTIFTLENTYTQHTGMIDVEIEGIPQYSPENFIELSSNSIQFTEPLVAGLDVVVKYFSEAQPLPSDLNQIVTNHTSTISNHETRIQSNTAQLADKATKAELLNTVGNISDGTPLFAPNVAGMTDITRNYVNTTDGLLYTHNGTQFVSTGVQYQSTGIADESVVRNNLSVNYNYVGVVGSGQVFTDLNAVTKEGMYVVLNTALNFPSGLTSTSIMKVSNANNIYIKQEIYDRYNIDRTYVRRIEPSNLNYGNWTKTIISNNLANEIGDGTLLNQKLSDTFNYNGSFTGVAMSTLLKEGHYVVTNATDKPTADSSGFLSVKRIADNIIQDYVPRSSPANKIQYRRIRLVGGSFGEWFKVSVDPKQGVQKFQTEKIVTMGDSITGASNYQLTIAERLGINVINCGFGGTRMTYHTDPDYDKFSFHKLVDAKISNNFTEQDDAASRLAVTNMNTNLQNLKNTDFSQVDYLSIWFGTNDFSGNIYLGTEGSEDKTTVKGALQYGIRRLLETYPQLKIFIITPMFRLVGAGNSDDTPNANRGLYLRDYADAIKEVSNYNHLPCLYMYDESGINRFNYTHYLSDGLHPYLDNGRIHVGQKISSFIGSNF